MINTLTVSQYYELCNHIDTSELHNEIDNLPLPVIFQEKETPKNIDDFQFRKILELRSIDWDSNYDCILKIIPVYLDKQIDVENLLICECLPIAKFIVTEIERINKRENEKLSQKTTSEERAAGIDKLKQLGDFMLIDSIAKRMHISHDDVLNLPYLLIFMMQWKDKELSDFKDRLNNIMQKQNERKNRNPKHN